MSSPEHQAGACAPHRNSVAGHPVKPDPKREARVIAAGVLKNAKENLLHQVLTHGAIARQLEQVAKQRRMVTLKEDC